MTPSNTKESLVERVARAIYEGPGVTLENDYSASVWEDAKRSARAAIAPMRDRLLELMRQRKAHYERKAEERDPLDEDGLNYRDVYTFAAEAMEATEDAITSMIQAALSEGEG